MRLNKYLALCGLGSRRAVEQLITAGQVAVNGRPVTDLSTQVEDDGPLVTVDGRPVHPVLRHNFDYIMLNKPRGYDVTRGGRHHHRRAWDLLPKDTHASVQSVGRLDRDSSGLLLFTNDGELAFRLTHPRYGCRKVYEVELEGRVNDEILRRLTAGVDLEDGPARAVSVERLPIDHPDNPVRLGIVMVEGRNRIVRRLCEAIGHPVLTLNRSAFGPLSLGTLPRGKTRLLHAREIFQLRKAVGLAQEPTPAPAREGAKTEKPVRGQKPRAPAAGRRGQGPRQPHEKAPSPPRRPGREGREGQAPAGVRPGRPRKP